MVQVVEKIVLFLVLPVVVLWLLMIMPPVVIENKVEIIAGIDNLADMLTSINSFFPVSVFFQCMIFWILIFNSELILKMGMWVLRKLPLGIN